MKIQKRTGKRLIVILLLIIIVSVIWWKEIGVLFSSVSYHDVDSMVENMMD